MTQTALANLRIVLVEPAGPLNVGAIARVMKNMGLSRLVLVNPQCDHLGDAARQMAVHAGEVLAGAEVVPTVAKGLVGCQWAIATTGRPRTLATTLEHPRDIMPWVWDALPQGQVALIFGPEDRGLNNDELNHAQRFVYIPSDPIYPSLNLAQAVGICCYELYQCRLATRRDVPPLLPSVPLPEALPAPLQELEGYYRHLEALLLRIGYLHPHTATRRMQKFRRLFSRAFPSREEVALLRGILSQVEWAIQNPEKVKPQRREEDFDGSGV